MRILFLCPHNDARSQMAEAFGNMLGAEGVEAYSGGVDPAAEVDPRAIEVMRELGYDMSAQAPKSMDDVPDVEFNYVVVMGCEGAAPVVKARMEIDWDVPDPRGMGMGDYRGVRDMIRSRIEKLLAAPRLAAD